MKIPLLLLACLPMVPSLAFASLIPYDLTATLGNTASFTGTVTYDNAISRIVDADGNFTSQPTPGTFFTTSLTNPGIVTHPANGGMLVQLYPASPLTQPDHPFFLNYLILAVGLTDVNNPVLQSAGYSVGVDGAGGVGILDVFDHFSMVPTNGTGQPDSVPEPTSASLFVAGALGFMAANRKEARQKGRSKVGTAESAQPAQS